VGMWAGAAAARQHGSDAGRWAVWLAAAFTIATAVWLVLLFARQHGVARMLGIATVPLAAGLLAALAGTSDESWTVSFLQLLAGSVFMGAVLDGLLLGHWYLTDRKLTRRPINRFALALLVAVALEAAAVIAGGFGPSRGSNQFSAILTAAGLAPWVALGMRRRRVGLEPRTALAEGLDRPGDPCRHRRRRRALCCDSGVHGGRRRVTDIPPRIA